MSRARLRITALVGLLGVALGALGAHGHIHDVITTNGGKEHWLTAVHYHQIHAVALLVLALLGRDESGKARFRLSFAAFLVGMLLFSGSLYVLAYTTIKWLGAITPFGGLAFMVGWGALVLGAGKTKSA